LGQSNNGEGVRGVSQSTEHAAVVGTNENGIGVFGKGGRLAARFEGDVEVTGDIILTNAADCAEDFEVAEGQVVDPGTVMVLGSNGHLEPCSRACDKRVVGVVSGGERFKPGIVLDRTSESDDRRPIALMGKVLCKVDADYCPVEVGDLLTTSPTVGHAMRAQDAITAFGAVIGKAMQPIAHGRGFVAVLVALQ
jgi:hypothetical protein